MKKNVKILGATAAALLAVAPVVASATTVNADFTINPGITNNNKPASTPLNINISLNATGNVTTGTEAANSVKASSSNGTLNRLSGSTVQIIDPANNNAVVTDQPLQAGHYYKVQISQVQVTGLTNSMTYNLGQATFGTTSTPTGSDLMTASTLTSAPFSLTESGNVQQPYFYNKGDNNTNQLSDGATAYVNNGNGVALASGTSATAANILAAAQNAVNTSVAPTANGPVVWTTEDVAKQLKDQGLKATNGVYSIPTNGFHITLSMKSLLSGKSVSVVVPFSGSEADYSNFPYVAFNDSNATSDGYNGNFSGLTAQGKQSKDSDQLVRTIALGSNFNSGDAVRGFKAWVKAPAADGTNTSSRIDMAVLSNPVNTQVPGQYTVTLQATNWANGKTTRVSYIVQVGQHGATYQTVNYPSAYKVNIWSIAGDTASFTGNRVNGGSRVATYDTKTVGGKSYTRIGSKDSNTWIQTQYLGVHNDTKPTTPAKPANNETKLNGVGRVSYNGKGSVRLLDADGHYVDQYVKKGSSFKVWAEKTVNGQHLYRIGSQSQWIPAKYLPLN